MNVMQWAYLFILPMYGYSSSISMPLGILVFLCVSRRQQSVTELFLVCTTGCLTQLNHQTRRPESLFQTLVQCRVIVSGEELADDRYLRWWRKRETILNTHCHNICSKMGRGERQILTFHSLCRNSKMGRSKRQILTFDSLCRNSKMGRGKRQILTFHSLCRNSKMGRGKRQILTFHSLCRNSKMGSGERQILTFHSLCRNKDRISPFPWITTFEKMGEWKRNQTDVCLCTSLAP